MNLHTDMCDVRCVNHPHRERFEVNEMNFLNLRCFFHLNGMCVMRFLFMTHSNMHDSRIRVAHVGR